MADSPAAGIGELNERSLHRALKARYAAGGGTMETAIDGYVADVLQDDAIVEIHTGSFWPLKKKLPRLLTRRRVTLVHPIAKDRYIVKLPEHPDAQPTRRRSPKHGSAFDVFSALASIPTLLEHPRLTLEVVLVAEEEIRIPNPRKRRVRDRDWISTDRRLLEVVETHSIARMADLFAKLDRALPEAFTTRHLAAAMNGSRRLGQLAAYCLREAGVSEICAKEGNALVYRRRTGARATATSEKNGSL